MDTLAPEKLPPEGIVDFVEVAAQLGVDLAPALAKLVALAADIDALMARTTDALELPCHRGCSMCCHQSAYLTPLEFFRAWGWAQVHLSAPLRRRVVAAGLATFRRHRRAILAIDGHLAGPGGLPAALNFRCPLLGEDEGCLVHPARELVARLFGGSRMGSGALYGCQLVALHLGGREAALPNAEAHARRVGDLPLAGFRQVYPWYIDRFYRD